MDRKPTRTTPPESPAGTLFPRSGQDSSIEQESGSGKRPKPIFFSSQTAGPASAQPGDPEPGEVSPEEPATDEQVQNERVQNERVQNERVQNERVQAERIRDEADVPVKASLPARTILSTIALVARSTPFEGRVYAVGGFLRDWLLGRPWGNEIDLVVEGDALEFARLLRSAGVATIPPITYPRFGTAMTRVSGAEIELVTARRERYQENSRKPTVEPATVSEDVLRRDFTINTLLMEIASQELLDPLGCARQDLAHRILRTPLDPDQTFFDDPLRMLRAVRFAAQLDFTIAPEVAGSILRNGNRLEIISRERIRDEFSKLLLSGLPSRGLAQLHSLGLMRIVSPELAALASDERPTQVSGELSSRDAGERWTHTLRLLDLLSALVRDASAPGHLPSWALPALVAALFHEALDSAALDRALGQGLRFSNEFIGEVRTLLQLRLEVVRSSMWDGTDALIRRWVRRAGDLLVPALDLLFADREAEDTDLADACLEQLQRRLTQLERVRPSASIASPLNGDEIMAVLNRAPGRLVSEAKEWLLNEALEGRLETESKDEAVRLLRSWYAQRSEAPARGAESGREE